MQQSLIAQYLPADYHDSFEREIATTEEITPDRLVLLIFTELPWWVRSLLWLRNQLVRLVGLKGGNFEEYIQQMIKCRSDREIVMGMDDRHLTFHVSLWCSALVASSQRLRVTTVVKYNNGLGKIYFFFIRPFHKLIIKSLLRRI